MDDPNHIYSCFDDPGPRILTHPFLACYPIQLRLPAYCRIVRPRDLGHPTCLGTDDDRFGRHRGFIQVDISDKSTHDIFYSLGAPLRQWKFDVSIGPRSGLEHVRQYQMQRSAGNEKVHVLQWDLKEAPSKLDGRIIVPRVYEGWTDGYSQSSGCYNDAIWLSKVRGIMALSKPGHCGLTRGCRIRKCGLLEEDC